MGLFGPPDVDKMEKKNNIKGLIKALRNGRDWGVNREAAEALGKIGDPRAVEPLIAVIKDEGISEAARALGKIGDSRAVAPLIAVLKDKNLRKDAVEALGKIGGPAVDPLIAALKDEDRHVRRAAAEALGKIGDPRAVEPLNASLEDKADYVRVIAAEALGKIGDLRAVEPLVNALKDKARDLRMTAANALGKIRDPRAVEPLVATLLDTVDIKVREAVIEALNKLGWQPDQGEAGDIYNAMYYVSMREWEKAAALGAPAVEPLIAALDREIFNKSDRKVRQDIASALVQIYSQKGLDEQSKKRILVLRERFTKRHVDTDTWGDCSEHEDRGIGIRFPL